jgi:LCP family protein required for cell wall assembly
MGKHSMSSVTVTPEARRGHPVIKWIAILVIASLLIGMAMGYAYVKVLENKMHPKGAIAQAVSKVLSEPAPREPINFLIIGSDWTAKEKLGRSDTLMILRTDLSKNKGVLISIPRDFRVEIPGNGKDKINHAFAYGGVPLTISTLEEYTGLPINHYIVVNYRGFQEMVDAIGGITIDVDERLVDWELGEPIEEGRQRMDGLTALHYVRFRNDPRGDFGRIERQQKFARALIDESTRLLNAFKLPQLVRIVSEHVETDMTFSEMLSLARNIKSLQQKNLETIMLPGKPDTIDGVSYVIPDEEKVNLILEMIKEGKPLDKALLEEVPNSQISIKVLNGCGVEGAAKYTGDFLSEEGFEVVGIGNADRIDYRRSVIYYRKKDYNKAFKVKKALEERLDPTFEESNFLDSQEDILLIVGSEYKQ